MEESTNPEVEEQAAAEDAPEATQQAAPSQESTSGPAGGFNPAPGLPGRSNPPSYAKPPVQPQRP